MPISPISTQVPSVKQIIAALAVVENKPKDADKVRASKIVFMKILLNNKVTNVSISSLEYKGTLTHKVTMG